MVLKFTRYNKRLRYKEENNQMGNLFTKLLLNSLYGKFAQKVERKELGFIFEEPKPKKGYRHRTPSHSAYLRHRQRQGRACLRQHHIGFTFHKGKP